MSKLFYEKPITEFLVIRGEEIFCGSPTYGDSGAAGGDTGDENYGDF